MKSKFIIPAIITMILSYSCSAPAGTEKAAKKYVYEWWYANKLGEAQAINYDGEWIDDWRHPLINQKHIKLKTNDEKSQEWIFFWFEREQYQRKGEVISKATESDNMIVKVFRFKIDNQWREWRVNQVVMDSRYSHNDAEVTFNNLSKN